MITLAENLEIQCLNKTKENETLTRRIYQLVREELIINISTVQENKKEL